MTTTIKKQHATQHPGYKHTPLGWIPEEWEVKKLKQTTSLVTNGFVGKAKDHYADEGILYIQGYNVVEYGFKFTGVKRVSEEFHQKNKKSHLQIDDLLTIQTGDVGVTTIVTKEVEGANCHALIITRFNKNQCFPKFYLQYFNSEIGKRGIKSIETGSTLKHVNVGDLINWDIALPPLPEQRKIAAILSTWDDAIQQTQALIAQLQKRNKGLAQQLLTGRKRLKGFEEEWKKTRIGKIIEEYKVTTENNNEYKILTSSNNGLITQEEYYGNSRIADRDNIGFNVIPKNYITYRSRSDNGIFTFNINNLGYTGAVSKYYPVFKLKQGDNNFFVKFLNLNKNIFGRYSVGTSQLVLSISEVKNIALHMPEAKEQEAIAAVLDKANEELKQQQQYLTTLQAQKKGLMQQLLTGAVRVKIEKE